MQQCWAEFLFMHCDVMQNLPIGVQTVKNTFLKLLLSSILAISIFLMLECCLTTYCRSCSIPSQGFHQSLDGERFISEIHMWSGFTASMVGLPKNKCSACFDYIGVSFHKKCFSNPSPISTFEGFPETQLLIGTFMSLSALRSRKTLPRVNGRWESHNIILLNSSQFAIPSQKILVMIFEIGRKNLL